MLLVARHQDQLKRHFRFVVPDAELALDLVDKNRFAALAERLDLPVPRTRLLDPTQDLQPSEFDVSYPCILKPLTRKPGWGSIAEPLTRSGRWGRIGAPAKVVEIESLDEMRRIWPRLRDAEIECLAQELVRGPESSIESYHTYVSASGDVLGEFTGRKIRTWPVGYGHSTALETSDAPDVAELGRWCMKRMGLVGPAKFDFKRDAVGRLHLLEVNPRYNLWHHLGAVAGVNLPEIAFGDLTGQDISSRRDARVGLTWCKPWHDVLAARASGMGTLRWLRWALAADAMRGISKDDPWPLGRAVAHRGWQRLRTVLRLDKRP
jgi:predicted ATP-grasp superfamily ATP-dependent carboligase